jgi:MFS family permease
MAEKQYDSGLVWRMSLNLTLNCLYGGYCVNAMSMNSENIAYSLGWRDSKQTYIYLFASIYALGAAAGGFLAGTIAHHFGRRFGLIVTDIIGIAACCLFLIPSTLTFGIGRLASGLTHGLVGTITPPFLKELSPSDMSGKTGAMVQMQSCIGILLVYVLGLALPIDDYTGSMNWWWMFMMVLPAGFLAVQLFGLLYIYPYDSPKWLIANDKLLEASNVLSSIYHKHAVEAVHRTLVQHYTDSEGPGGSVSAALVARKGTYKDILTDWRFRRMLIIGLGLMFLQQWCGINAVLMYSTIIFQSMTDKFTARLYTVGLGFVNIIGVLIAINCIDTYGRRPLLALGELSLGLVQVVLGIVIAAGLSPVLVVVLISAYLLLYNLSMGTVVWVYCGEVLSMKCMGLSVGFGWANVFFVLLSFQYIIVPGVHAAFLLYGVTCLSGFLFILAYIQETKGLTKEEICQQVVVTRGYSYLVDSQLTSKFMASS